VVVAFDASYPIEELIGVDADQQSADESGERSGSDRDFPDESPQNETAASRTTPAPRKATGRVPSAAKSTVPKRTPDELLTDARRITAEWPTENLTADRIRKSVRTSAESARTLRDSLRAERADGTQASGAA
jgi:hypothetical protein